MITLKIRNYDGKQFVDAMKTGTLYPQWVPFAHAIRNVWWANITKLMILALLILGAAGSYTGLFYGFPSSPVHFVAAVMATVVLLILFPIYVAIKGQELEAERFLQAFTHVAGVLLRFDGYDFHDLAKWPSRIYHARAMATRALTRLAVIRLGTETLYKDPRDPHRVSAHTAFEQAYNSFEVLCLIELLGGYGPYYRKAMEEL